MSSFKQGTPPPVPPKPNRRPGQLSPAKISSLETRLSEDSGISNGERSDIIAANLSSLRLINNSLTNDTSQVSRHRSRPSEIVFAAVGTPIKTSVKHVQEPAKQVPEKVEYQPENGGRNLRIQSLSSENDYQSEEEQFTLGRNNTRKSMFADNPVLDRWAEKQEENMLMVRDYI